MTPQSHFMILAPVAAGREASLRALLASMNVVGGQVDPANATLPFGAFDTLHFARLVLIDDATSADLTRFGVPRPTLPSPCLAFMGDCDGDARSLLATMTRDHADGVRRLFGHCDGVDAATDLLAWLVAHDLPIQSFYVNTRGRTVRRVRENSALRRALSARVARTATTEPERVRRDLRAFAFAEREAGRLSLTPEAPTPADWQWRNLVHLVGVPLVALVLAPLWLLLLPFAIVLLRIAETRDPAWCPRPAPDAVLEMQHIEDRDVSNSFTAVGAAKPGWFRLALLRIILLALDYAARHLFDHGFLTRVQTIHFARWVFIDDRRRVLFASNYDGSHESYMDDFINKVGWGLNIVFSNGFGWPRTDWLVLGGSRREMEFKHYQRRHQLPTQVWYKAYPGLTLHDLDRDARVRDGLEAETMSDGDALAWLRLL